MISERGKTLEEEFSAEFYLKLCASGGDIFEAMKGRVRPFFLPLYEFLTGLRHAGAGD
ncbi:MAG: hypothetical protein OXC60_15895 [Litoreibacter sp.]|nr:hypothetical protein [Litoreibacter sp.]MCY4336142.1 hypothetical protein [Litoreibacter sp.]